MLANQIMSQLDPRAGAAPSNFADAWPAGESELMQQLTKEPTTSSSSPSPSRSPRVISNGAWSCRSPSGFTGKPTRPLGCTASETPSTCDSTARWADRRSASEAFAEHGLDVTLNSVDAYAGVGVGTVYRRFATKEALIDELFERRLDRLGDLADALSRDADAWNAPTAFLEGSMQLMLEDRGFMAILQHPDPGVARVRQNGSLR